MKTELGINFPVTENNSWDYQLKVPQMMMQINRLMTQFLDNLDYIYLQNKINFKTKNYKGILLRMLAPIELATQFGLTNNESIFMQPLKGNSTAQSKMSDRKKDKKKHVDVQSTKLYLYHDDCDAQLPLLSPSVPCVVLENKKKSARGQACELGKDTEEALVQWIKLKFIQGDHLNNFEIMKKAKQMSPNKNFRASSGWFHRFARRFPQVKTIMSRKYTRDSGVQIGVKDGVVVKQSEFLDQDNDEQKQWVQVNDEKPNLNILDSSSSEQQFQQIPIQKQSIPQQQQYSIKPIYSSSLRKIQQNQNQNKSLEVNSNQNVNNWKKKTVFKASNLVSDDSFVEIISSDNSEKQQKDKLSEMYQLDLQH